MTETVRRPPFDPELEAVLTLLSDQMPMSITPEMIPLMRQAAPAPGVGADDALTAAGIVRRDVTIPGHDGDEIEVSVLSRQDRTGVGPGIYYTHGGGMIMGDRDPADGLTRPHRLRDSAPEIDPTVHLYYM